MSPSIRASIPLNASRWPRSARASTPWTAPWSPCWPNASATWTPAARIKPDRDAVFDQARIDDVVAKVLVAAEAHHLSPDIAEPVWRLLIDRCIAHEFATYDRTRS